MNPEMFCDFLFNRNHCVILYYVSQYLCYPVFNLVNRDIYRLYLQIIIIWCENCSLKLFYISVFQIYDLATGKILLSVIFPEMLMSVAVSPSEMDIFVGCHSGDINQFSLRNPKNVNSSEVHISAGILSGDNDITNVFQGHKKLVNSLSVSIDGERLLSGSLDESVRIWHITSKQCLKILTLRGPVTNAFFTNAPKQMLEQDVKRKVVLCPFKKTQDANEEGSEYCVEIMNYTDLDVSRFDVTSYDIEHLPRKLNFMVNDSVDSHSMKDEINRLRNINERLYKCSVQQLLQKRIDENDSVSPSKIGDKNSDVCNETSNIIDNIFDNLITYQKQPEFRNKPKKKKKNRNKGSNDEALKGDDINILSMKKQINMKKKKLKKKS